MVEFEYRVEARGGHCLLHRDDSKNYGVGSVRLVFHVIGSKGSVQWMIGTDWYPEAARRHLAKFPARYEMKPSGWDLGYHAKEPQYEGQGSRECHLLPEGKCFYDGSGLNADLLIEGFLNGGTDWLWPQLEAYYRSVYEDAPFPEFAPVIRQHKPENLDGAIEP